MLDLGAGTGRYAAAAVRYGVSVVGVDRSQAMLRVARQRTKGLPVQFVHADALRLPFPTAAFDAALAVTSLCFVADPVLALREAVRLLRPGGRLVLGELNRWSLWALLRRIEGLIRPTTYRTAHFRSIGELRALLAAAGFTLVRWEGVLHLPPLNHAGILRALDPIERLGQHRTSALGAFLAIEARPPGFRAYEHAASQSAVTKQPPCLREGQSSARRSSGEAPRVWSRASSSTVRCGTT